MGVFPQADQRGPVGVVDVTVAVTVGVAADGATAVLPGAVLADPAAHIDVLRK